MLEIISTSINTESFRVALFDFDGTLSLIREGWQDIMKLYFYNELKRTPLGRAEDNSSIMTCINAFVDMNTGKQPEYQCLPLLDEIKKRNGEPEEVQFYLEEYQCRLKEHVHDRIIGLEKGTLNVQDYLVPGCIEFLKMLEVRGIKLYLASGTDEEHVRYEAKILGIDIFFCDDIYGPNKERKDFSKKMVVEKIIRDNEITGNELIGIGDGFVEIDDVKEVGGFAIGIASDEKEQGGNIDAQKRERLIRAGADIIIPDFAGAAELNELLFGAVRNR